MGKGTVGHIKYYPDHTFIFLGYNPQPSPRQAPGSTAQQGMAEPPMPMNQVPTKGYNRILHYTGCFSISDMGGGSWVTRWVTVHPEISEKNLTCILQQHLSCADAHMPGAGPISNIFPISNFCPIDNICPIGNICPIDNIFPIGNI
jgi:hypothetical protein